MIASYVLSGLAIGSVYALVGLALVLVNKATDVVNFAQGETAMVGTFVMLSFMKWTGLPLPVVFALGILFGLALGALTERLFIHPVRDAPPLNLLITTIGLWFCFNGAASWIWGYDPYRFPSLLSQAPVGVGGLQISPASLAVVAVALVLMGALYCFFEFTREGTAMRAASGNPRAAALMGINAARVATISWALAGAVSVAAGMLIEGRQLGKLAVQLTL